MNFGHSRTLARNDTYCIYKRTCFSLSGYFFRIRFSLIFIFGIPPLKFRIRKDLSIIYTIVCSTGRKTDHHGGPQYLSDVYLSGMEAAESRHHTRRVPWISHRISATRESGWRNEKHLHSWSCCRRKLLDTHLDASFVRERKEKEERKRNGEKNRTLSVFQNHSIHNLDTFTQYLVSLQVFNPEGHGPASTVTVMTDEGGK